MRLYLVRHGEAAGGSPDELRQLTQAGRAQARALGARLRAEGVAPDAVLTSPLLRARETAGLLAEELGVEAAVEAVLAPGATAEGLVRAVAGRGETVVVVAHQPDCSRIAGALTGGPEPGFAPCSSLVIELAS